MKKLINGSNAVVSEMLSGMAKAFPALAYDPKYAVISRAHKKVGKVGLVSGGGSGHEPAHAGYVGEGMLDAAVSGNVFASPDPEKVLTAIRLADSGKGVLLVIKNYSGDVMNFEMAAELAAMEGIDIQTVVVHDDVAVADSTFSTGRRGIAGTVFVHKIAGAKAESGASLTDVQAVAQKVVSNVRSMGMSMSSCILPGVGKPNFILAEDEVEIGMGIHGEPGIERMSMRNAREIVALMLERILSDLDYNGAETAVMINGMGATPLMELYIVCDAVVDLLAARDICVHRVFTGNFMTSLEMAGCSLSLLRLDEETKTLLDAHADTPAFKVF